MNLQDDYEMYCALRKEKEDIQSIKPYEKQT